MLECISTLRVACSQNRKWRWNCCQGLWNALFPKMTLCFQKNCYGLWNALFCKRLLHFMKCRVFETCFPKCRILWNVILFSKVWCFDRRKSLKTRGKCVFVGVYWVFLVAGWHRLYWIVGSQMFLIYLGEGVSFILFCLYWFWSLHGICWH